jgi:hypothetical protein
VFSSDALPAPLPALDQTRELDFAQVDSIPGDFGRKPADRAPGFAPAEAVDRNLALA